MQDHIRILIEIGKDVAKPRSQQSLDGSAATALVELHTITNGGALDDYCREKKIATVDLIKIGRDALTLEVLKSSRNILKSTDFVQFVYDKEFRTSKTTLTAVYAELALSGFSHVYIICPNYLCLCPYPIENYSYANYLAFRSPPIILLP
jgi:hypothetical protein